jgi:hypothetical protein
MHVRSPPNLDVEPVEREVTADLDPCTVSETGIVKSVGVLKWALGLLRSLE